MRALRARVSIHSRPADVFRVLTSFDHYHQWNPWLKDVQGEAKEGTVVSVRPNLTTTFGVRLRYRLEKIQPKDFLRWQEEAWFGFLFHTTREYQVYTRLGGSAIYSVRLSFNGPLAKAVGMFYGRACRRGLLREAEALKRYCEQHYPLPPGQKKIQSGNGERADLTEIDFSE